MHARPLSGNGQIRESARETMAEPAEQVHALILCKLHSQVLQPYQNQTASSTPVRDLACAVSRGTIEGLRRCGFSQWGEVHEVA